MADKTWIQEPLFPAAEVRLKNKKLLAVNMLSDVRRLRAKNEKGDSLPHIVPLVHISDVVLDEKGKEIKSESREAEIASMNALFVSHVIKPMAKTHDDMGIGPSSLMMTSVFGPFNRSRPHVENLLIAEYEDTRIYFTGKLLAPDHLILFATLLKSYVNASEEEKTFDNRVTIDREELIYSMYGKERIRFDGKGGMSPFYNVRVSALFNELRLSTIKVVEGGDKEGSVGKGKGYITNFLRELNWSEEKGTFTYAIDFRVANLYALNGHTFVYLAERARHINQADVDELTMDLQNTFRLRKRAALGSGKGAYEASFTIGELMFKTNGFKFSKGAFVDRIISAATKLDNTVVDEGGKPLLRSCTITGFSLDDIVKISTDDEPYNIINQPFELAKALIEKYIKESQPIKKRDKRPMEERLAARGLKCMPVRGVRVPKAVVAPAVAPVVATPAMAPAVATPANVPAEALVESSTIKRLTPNANGLRGSYLKDDKPTYYIKLNDFDESSENFAALADDEGGFPIYESWIKEKEEQYKHAFFPANASARRVRDLISKACMWAVFNKNKSNRSTISQVHRFIDGFIQKQVAEEELATKEAYEKEAKRSRFLKMLDEKNVNSSVKQWYIEKQ